VKMSEASNVGSPSGDVTGKEPVMDDVEEEVQVEHGKIKERKLMTNTFCVWTEEAFDNFCRGYGILPEWEPTLPSPTENVLSAGPGQLALYEAHFTKCGFRLPCTRFQIDTLVAYGVGPTQLTAFGMLRLVHFEASCRALDIEPTVEMLNVFYFLARDEMWFSFKPRPKVPPMATHTPKSLHWAKEKFFFVKRGVIPISLPWKVIADGQRVADIPVMKDFKKQAWFTTLTANATKLEFKNLTDGIFCLLGMSCLTQGPGKEPYIAAEGKHSFSFNCL
jgi:hypothetical protein